MNYLVIPAYNPDINLLLLAEAFADNPELQLIVVDDGSLAQAQDIFRKVSDFAIVLTHNRNRGKGCAIKTALRYIMQQGNGHIIVTADADGQHSVSDILTIYRASCQNPNRLILGVRNFHSDTPLRSLLGNKMTSLIFFLISGQRLSDTQTGLRGFSSELIPLLLTIKGDRYEYEMNVLLQLSRQKVPFAEVLIQTIYLDKNRLSHFRVIADSLRIYGQIFRFSASSLICFGVDLFAFAFFNHFLSLNSFLTYRTLNGTYTTLGLSISNISARLISSALNFTLNRNIVFRQNRPKKHLWKSLRNYYLLAAIILALNTGLLYLLVAQLQISPVPAKLLTECALFFISFFVQKRIVFQ